MTAPDQEKEKEAAAEQAARLVSDGMVVGLGTGSTASLFVRALGRRVAEGLRVIAIPTSDRTESLAREMGIRLSTLEIHPSLDMTIDGADEVDPDLNLIKGGGGALLREKLVALAAERYVIIADATKRVPYLGAHMPLPVEVVTFGWMTTRTRLQTLGLDCLLRGGDSPFITDGGNYILDCRATTLAFADPLVAGRIKGESGVVEHGLYLRMADTVIFGMADGTVRVEQRRSGSA